MRIFPVAIAAALSLSGALFSAPATADIVVANFDFAASVAQAPDGSFEFRPFVAYGDPTIQPALGYMNNATMAVIDVLQGNSYELSGDFANFAAKAVNGSDDPFYIGVQVVNGVADWDATSESVHLSTASMKAPGVGSPDYAGYELTRITVMPTSFQQLQNGQIDVSVMFTVYGNRLVPEPGLFTLAALGFAGVATMRRRH